MQSSCKRDIMKMKTTAMILVLLACCTALGQEQATPPPAARPADVKSIESTVAAVYDVISGPAGQKRDWNRFRGLFAPGARLIPLVPQTPGGFAARVLSVEDYVVRTEPLFAKESFYEQEAGRRTEQWGHIAQVFSTYESRRAKGEKPFMRGVNSIQLMNDGRRWWIVSVMWERESAEQPLPKKYLKREQQPAAQPSAMRFLVR